MVQQMVQRLVQELLVLIDKLAQMLEMQSGNTKETLMVMELLVLIDM